MQLAGSTSRLRTTSIYESRAGFLFPKKIRKVNLTTCEGESHVSLKVTLKDYLNFMFGSTSMEILPILHEQNVQDKYLERFNFSSIIMYLDRTRISERQVKEIIMKC